MMFCMSACGKALDKLLGGAAASAVSSEGIRLGLFKERIPVGVYAVFVGKMTDYTEISLLIWLEERELEPEEFGQARKILTCVACVYIVCHS